MAVVTADLKVYPLAGICRHLRDVHHAISEHKNRKLKKAADMILAE
jgi:hypothetical protein